MIVQYSERRTVCEVGKAEGERWGEWMTSRFSNKQSYHDYNRIDWKIDAM